MSSLQGKHIVVTRAPHQNQSLIELLEAQQAIHVVYPCIDIAPPEDTTQLDAALQQLEQFDWLALTSSNTVYALHQRLTALGIQWPDAFPIIACIGPKTADIAAEMLGGRVLTLSEGFTAKDLASALSRMKAGDMGRIFLPQSEIARPELAQTLEQMGCHVTVVTAYRTICGTGGDDVIALLKASQIDGWTFASPSAVRNCLKRLENEGASEQTIEEALQIPCFCIGPTTASAASKCSFQTIVSAERYTAEGLVTTVKQYFERETS